MKKSITLASMLIAFSLTEIPSWAAPDDEAPPREPAVESQQPTAQPTSQPSNATPTQPVPPSGEAIAPHIEPTSAPYEAPRNPYFGLEEERAPTTRPVPSSEAAANKLESVADILPKTKYPQLLGSPSAHLLPAALVQSSLSLDTGGSVGGSVRIGLGDVGEFGIETSPQIRMRTFSDSKAQTIQPLVLASFRMGISENRIFDNQPALAIGFRKSFSRQWDDNQLRVAAVDLVASKTFKAFSLHVGGVFWDARMVDVNSGSEILLHDNGYKTQIRPFGGLTAEPFKNSQLLIDLYWVPLFSPYQTSSDAAITLRPTLSWGVRYSLSDAVSFESGVRVPDIGEANLLDAQIFGQLTWSSDKIRKALGVKAPGAKQ